MMDTLVDALLCLGYAARVLLFVALFIQPLQAPHARSHAQARASTSQTVTAKAQPAPRAARKRKA